MLSDFDTYSYLKALQPTELINIKDVDKMVYVPYPHNWGAGDQFDNLTQSYNITTEGVFVSIKELNEGTFKPLSSEEGMPLLNLISDSPIILNLMDTYRDIDDFQRKSVKFLVESNDKENKLYLYYKDSMFLVADGPYYIDLTRTINGKAFSYTKMNAYKKFIKVIKQYAGENLPVIE